MKSIAPNTSQWPVPAQDRIRCHDGRNLSQHFTSQQLTLDSQATALVVVKKDPFLPQFLFEELILCDQVIDRMLLLPIDQAGKTEQEYMPWLNDEAHTLPPGSVDEKRALSDARHVLSTG